MENYETRDMLGKLNNIFSDFEFPHADYVMFDKCRLLIINLSGVLTFLLQLYVYVKIAHVLVLNVCILTNQ